MATIIFVMVLTPGGDSIPMFIDLHDKISKIVTRLARMNLTDIFEVRLICNGKALLFAETVMKAGIRDGDSIYLLNNQCFRVLRMRRYQRFGRIDWLD